VGRENQNPLTSIKKKKKKKKKKEKKRKKENQKKKDHPDDPCEDVNNVFFRAVSWERAERG